LTDVKPITADRTGRVRFLTPEEETRLRKALAKRDARRRARRVRSNRWRRARGYEPWPPDAPDHLTPIVSLALNTGLRKGEIFNLRWADADLRRAQLTVRGTGAKSGQTRHVPLNREAVAVLRAWQTTTTDQTAHVFAGRSEGEPLDDVKKAWLPVVKAAKLKAFTFHDLRHTFASKLVMAGVDLNTVRELLGHADIKMTLRYAHIAPAHAAAAVAKLL
jgi:integrase